MATVAKPESAPTNARGIPYAPFVDRVEDYVSDRSQVDATVNSFKEMISKYQFMQQNTQRRATGLRTKIPDILKTLETVRFLALHSPTTSTSPPPPLETTFELNDTLYARASIPPTSEVYLWLGANLAHL
ncbi:similar to prefoldin subunit 3 [Plenodomus lingam JN3]|uniref:Similar to prefoldin subunit 3 n=1 Tax=Leptosphaeria maculans (strain JN3 / isolate v23.1.3 / race Av1-4-5-6-7-8) TaxID=985895 RepID=E5A494_LEPMJ|nr:similar to prefoldin subunit 3 [Plenodomus lingam JN3]CBX98439.1 similar to prefoldin subunit 3 [Plenodomus lingam JN3]